MQFRLIIKNYESKEPVNRYMFILTLVLITVTDDDSLGTVMSNVNLFYNFVAALKYEPYHHRFLNF